MRFAVVTLLLQIILLQRNFCDGREATVRLDLNDLYSYLRYDDNRLVRYNVPSSEAERRQLSICSKHMFEFLDELLSSNTDSIERKRKIIQLLTLCSSENPKFRQQIGSYGGGNVLKEIINIINFDDKSAAIAGEAIWILSFNNHHNHDYFVNGDAISKLQKVLITKVNRKADKTSISSSSEDSIKSVMWAAAALQNLCASYCETESGHCLWEFHPDYDDEDYQGNETDSNNETPIIDGLYLHDESRVAIDGSNAAKKIVSSTEFVNVLSYLICKNAPMGENDRLMPSTATIHDAINDSRMYTWSVAGLIKNLSMYKISVSVVHAVKECLCKLTSSADWLESSKAGDALYRSGVIEECNWDEEESAHGDYFHEDYEL